MNIKKCIKRECLLYSLAFITNLLLLFFFLTLFINTYHANERLLSLLAMIPPLLSLMTLRQHDREERTLEKRIRKAHLRKELKELSEFDQS